MSELVWVEAPWGRHAVVDSAPNLTVKLLEVRAGEALSVQKHRERAERWTVLSGLCLAAAWQDGAEPEGGYLTLGPGGRLLVPVGWTHHLVGVEDTLVLELCEGRYEPFDIVRLSDRYGR